MTEDTKQAVAENADASQSAGAEVGGAQAEMSLDELLDSANFNGSGQASSQSEPSSQAATDDLTAVVNSLKQEVSQLREENASSKFQTEFDETASRLSDGLDVEPEAFKDALYGRVARDQRLTNAYENRGKDPAAWRQVEQALQGEFKKRYPAKSETDGIDEALTQDREAVAASVRGQASTASRSDEPTEAEIAAMSDKEFNDYQRKRGAPMFS